MAMLDSVSEMLEIIEKHPGRTTRDFRRLGYTSEQLNYLIERPELVRVVVIPARSQGNPNPYHQTHFYPVSEEA